MSEISRPMLAALNALADADAALSGDVWLPTFRTPGGSLIDGQTVKALARRALARTTGPDRTRFTLTTAGRRLARTLA